MSALNTFKDGLASFGSARMVAGNFGTITADGHALFIGPGGVEFSKVGANEPRQLVYFPAEALEEFETISAESRLTATRLLTLGLANTELEKDCTWIRVMHNLGQQSVFEVRALDNQVDAWVDTMLWMQNMESDSATQKPQRTSTASARQPVTLTRGQRWGL